MELRLSKTQRELGSQHARKRLDTIGNHDWNDWDVWVLFALQDIESLEVEVKRLQGLEFSDRNYYAIKTKMEKAGAEVEILRPACEEAKLVMEQVLADGEIDANGEVELAQAIHIIKEAQAVPMDKMGRA